MPVSSAVPLPACLKIVPACVGQRTLRCRATAIGYDFSRGRLDSTVHPFEVSQNVDDVRITTRFNESFISAALFGTLHESGHGMYEQGVDPALSRTALTTDLPGMYAVGGTSFGTHESQSRLFENHVGRSHAFWSNHYPALQAAFPEGLGDVSGEEFYEAVNVCQPSFIRVEADELHYDFHIMMRVEIEVPRLPVTSTSSIQRLARIMLLKPPELTQID